MAPAYKAAYQPVRIGSPKTVAKRNRVAEGRSVSKETPVRKAPQSARKAATQIAMLAAARKPGSTGAGARTS